METMAPEIIVIFKYIGLVSSGSLGAIILSKLLGKTKEEAEIVLNWEEIHEKRDKKLLAEIKRLEDKMDDFIEQMEKERINHKREILLWEESDRKKDVIIKDRENTITKLLEEIELKD